MIFYKYYKYIRINLYDFMLQEKNSQFS